MPVQFLHRDACPLCSTEARQCLCDLAFEQAPVAPFLEFFYAGRLDPARLADGRYRVFCCDASSFIYQDPILDDAGKLIATDARDLLGVKELQTVVVQGKAKRDDKGNLTVMATGVFVKS